MQLLNLLKYQLPFCKLKILHILIENRAVENEFIKMISVQLGGLGESLLLISKKGNLLLVNGQTVINQQVKFFYFSEENQLEQEVDDFVFDPIQEKALLLSPNGELSSLSIVQPTILSENVDESSNLGEITLENVSSFNKLELEPLSFVCYPPPEVKQTTINERNGIIYVLLNSQELQPN